MATRPPRIAPNDMVIGHITGIDQALQVQGDLKIVNDSGTELFVVDISGPTITMDTFSMRLGDNDKLEFGDAQDITMAWDGTDFDVLQATADSSIKWGVSGAGIDHVFYGDTATRDIPIDQSANSMIFNDNALLVLGTGSDVTFNWDGTSLKVTQATTNSQVVFGVSGAGIDIQLFGDTAGRDLLWDQSADSLLFNDSALLVFGTGSDVTMRWDGTDFDILSVADDGIIKFGTGTNSFDLWIYGNIATAYLDTDASASLVRLNGPMRLSGFNRLSPRYELKWVAGARGKPGINADINSATESVREIADPDFEILGVNGRSEERRVGK